MPLLPIFYDICKVIMGILRNPSKTRIQIEALELGRIENELDRCCPSASLEAINKLDSIEVLHIFQKGQALRLAAYLIIRRLSFPYGDPSDEKRSSISRKILSQLTATTKTTGRSVICSEFAFKVACFELQYKSEQISTLSELQNISVARLMMSKAFKASSLHFGKPRETWSASPGLTYPTQCH